MVAIFTGLGTGFERGSGSLLGSLGLLGSSTLGRGGEQLFFNAATGNLMVSQRDEYLVGLGLDAAVSRTYNSFGDFSDDNGDNWRQGYDRRITNLTGTLNTAGSTVQRVSGDGSVITYSWDTAKSAYVATDGAGAYDKLTSSGGVWTWTDGDSQLKESYAAYGGYWRLTSQADTDGNAISFTYTGDKLTQVTTADGSTLTYSWSGNNLISVVTSYDPGAETPYVDQIFRLYDAAFDRAPDPSGLNAYFEYLRGGGTPIGFATSLYNSSEYAARGVGSMTNDQYVDFLYQSVLRRTATPSERSYYVDQLNSGALTRAGALLIFADSAEHQTIMSTIPGRTFAGTLTLTRTRYAYDAQGRLSTVTVDLSPGNNSVTDGKTYVTTYTYDGTSTRVASIAQSDGSLIAITYDGSGRVATLTQTASTGVTRTSSMSYASGYTTITDALGQATQLGYDGAGKLTSIKNFDNRIFNPQFSGTTGWDVTYNPNGIAGAAYSGTAWGKNYIKMDLNATASGQIASLGTAWANWATVTPGEQLFAQAGVEPLGSAGDAQLAVWFLDASGATIGPFTIGTLYGNQSFNSKISGYVTVPAGAVSARLEVYTHTSGAGSGSLAVTEPILAAANQLAQFAYNANGDVTSVTDALGNVTSYSNFDAYGNAQTITDRLGNVTTRTFGSKNELLTETRDASDTTQFSRPVTTRYVYDSENHLRFLISAEGNVTEYRYNTNGVRSYTIGYPEHLYDVSGLASNASISEATLNAWVNSLGDRSSTQITNYVYDARGNITEVRAWSMATAGGAVSWAEGTTATFFVYDQAGNLRSRYAQGRNTETFVYDGLNRLTASVDVAGATTTYVFNDANTTTTVSYATGLTQVSTYNKAGDLISFAETAAPTAQQAWTGTATYGYDKDGRLRWQLDATGRKSYFAYDQRGRKIADVSINGDVVQYRYDANDRLVAQISFYNALDPALVAALDNADAAINLADVSPAAHGADIWQWRVYDKEGRLIRSIEGDGATVELTYDQSGQLLSTTSYYNILSSTLVASFKAGTATPDATTRPTADAARDSVARNFYDKAGRLVGVLDGEGYLTKFAYDQAGQKTRETHYFNPTGGNRATDSFNTLLASITLDSSKDRNSYYSYDGQGHLRYIVDSLGYVTETNYDSAGQATSVTQYAIALPATSDYTFDNVKSLVASGGLPASVGTRTSYTVYDTAGRPAYVIDPEGTVTANSYNAAGQLTKTVQFATPRTTTSLPTKATMDSWSTTNGGNAANRVNRFYYDGAGVLRYTIDGEGYLSRTDRDAEGRVVMTSRWANAYTTVDDSKTINDVDAWRIASGGTVASTSTSYDLLGRVEYVTDAEGIQTRYWYRYNGQLGREFRGWGTADATTTAFWYDTANRLIGRTDAYETPEAAGTGYTYDGLGNVLTVTDANGQVTTNSYDRRGLLIKQKDALLGETSYQYDAFGGAVKVTDPRGFATFNYYDRRGLLVASRDAENYVTETSYTAFGQADTVIRRYNKATGTAVVGTLPTVSAHASDASTHFDYDRRGLVTKVTDAEGYYEQYTLNAFGERTSVRNKVGGTVTNSYDRRGLLVSETLPMAAYRADGTVEASSVTNTFEYDARGNRTRMIEAYGLTEQRTTNYSYDKVNRLKTRTLGAVATVGFNDFTSTTGVTVTSTSGVVPTESYDYDALGRLKQVTSALGGRTVSFYDHLGRKTAEVSPVGTLSSWTYDANGNMLTARVYGDAVTVPALTASAPPAPVNASNYRETVYTYDNINRLKTTSIANVLAGSWNGTTGVAPTTQAITTTLDYDANGNVIKATDANGNATYAYFDGLGRKTGQVDAENYITTWTYDGEGNVKKETRFATQYVGTPPTGGTTAPTVAADATNDRVTDFTYDRNGRRLTEARANVKIATVNATNGAITESTVTSTVSYTYNGLGQVLTKAEGTGDTVTYSYDATGRLTKEARASYADQGGATVTPTVDYLYNGLNDLARTRQGGATANAGDRITTYAYGANGRLSQVVDPAGATHNYDYDAAGNIMRDWYVRTKSDGTTQVTEGILYRRDLLGRVIGQAIATKNSDTSWTRGDGQNSEYNAYGDMARRGINGLWQETFAYNNRGLVEKSNSGDGVWRFFVYDKNGNQTLAIEDENYTPQDLSTKTLSQVLGYLGATAGATFVDGLNVTISIYDKRNMATQSRLPQRETTAIGSALTSINSSQAYNAFGEATSQTDALNNVTTLTYNTMGRLIQKVMPQVSVTSTGGVVSTVNPTEYYYYDQSGRQVAMKDANGNLLSRTLLAGSGYGEAEALVTAEYHADGGIAKTFYDQFGDARILRNEAAIDETRAYDAMGRVSSIVRRTGLKEDYSYDILGQQLKHVLKNTTNTVLGTETSDYDLQGRVISTVDMAGDTTTYSYAWSASVSTALGTSGGWIKTTKQWAQLGSSLWKTKTETTDVHGLTTQEVDFGGNTTNYTYDKAGRLTQKVGTAGSVVTTLNFTNFNTGLVASTTDATTGMTANSITSTFAYDVLGRRTKEKYLATTLYRSLSDASYTTLTGVANQTLQDATTSYDALGRITTVSSTSSVGTVTVNQYYDAAGNIRRTQTSSPNLVAGGTASSDKWFTYDSMNRMVIVNGTLVGSAVKVEDIAGALLVTYDVLGNRQSAAIKYSDYIDGPNGPKLVHYSDKELYYYDNDSQLSQVDRYQSEGNITQTLSTTTRDIQGRVTHYTEYQNGVASNDRYSIVYNARGQASSEHNYQLISGSTDINATITYTYDSYGNLTYQRNVNAGLKDTWQSWTIGWRDQAVTTHSDYDKDYYGSNNLWYADQYYDGLGRLQRAFINDNKDRAVHFALNGDGQILARVQNDGSSDDPRDYHLFVAGKQVAEFTNNANEDLRNYDYRALIGDKTSNASGSGDFWHGATTGTQGAELGTSGYDPINAITAGTGQNSRSRYTVKSGDTLQGIAAALWGDSSLWYKLAEANGLGANATLAAGQALSVPLNGPSNRNNADMFRPYDASSAVGDLSPTQAKPPKNKKCAMFGQLLLVAIAVAVSIALPGGGTGITAVINGAINGAIGSAASQAVGVATGLQDKFSFKQVALSALAAGVTAGIGPKGVFGDGGLFGGVVDGKLVSGAIGTVSNATIRAGLQAATSSAITQGIGVVTKLQPKFSWAGVAAAGVAAGVGVAIDRSTSADAAYKAGNAKGWISRFLQEQRHNGGYLANRALSGMASSIADAATRSVIEGSDFGDNLVASLPNTIGSTVGTAVAERLQSGPALVKGDFYGSSSIQEAKISDHILDLIQGRATWGQAWSGVKSDFSGTIQSTVEEAQEIVVTARRRLYEYATEAWNSRTAQIIMGHPRARSSGGTASGVAVTIRRAATVNANNFRNDYVNRVDHGIASMKGGWATLNDSRPYASGDGFSANLSTLKGLGSIVGGAIEYVAAPILGPSDTSIGRPLSIVSNGHVRPTTAGDSVLIIGSMFLGPEVGLSSRPGGIAAAESAETATVWNRLSTVGRTPGKSSATGRAVIQRMEAEGAIFDDPVLGKMFKASDGEWYPMKLGDMSHTTDAVTWWNSTGRAYGAKAPEVRSWMLSSDNYTIDLFSINRSAGAKLGNSGVTYLPPGN